MHYENCTAKVMRAVIMRMMTRRKRRMTRTRRRMTRRQLIRRFNFQVSVALVTIVDKLVTKRSIATKAEAVDEDFQEEEEAEATFNGLAEAEEKDEADQDFKDNVTPVARQDTEQWNAWKDLRMHGEDLKDG
jgi:hypothetical protein